MNGSHCCICLQGVWMREVGRTDADQGTPLTESKTKAQVQNLLKSRRCRPLYRIQCLQKEKHVFLLCFPLVFKVKDMNSSSLQKAIAPARWLLFSSEPLVPYGSTWWSRFSVLYMQTRKNAKIVLDLNPEPVVTKAGIVMCMVKRYNDSRVIIANPTYSALQTMTASKRA